LPDQHRGTIRRAMGMQRRRRIHVNLRPFHELRPFRPVEHCPPLAKICIRLLPSAGSVASKKNRLFRAHFFLSPDEAPPWPPVALHFSMKPKARVLSCSSSTRQQTLFALFELRLRQPTPQKLKFRFASTHSEYSHDYSFRTCRSYSAIRRALKAAQ